MKIYNIYTRVKHIMQDNPEARNNDGLLIAMVDIGIRPEVGSMPYAEVMRNRTALGLPPCESIRRSRQKAQETTPGLASNKRVQQLREKNREEIEDFVRSAT